MSLRFNNIMARLPYFALKSLNLHQHGAVVLKNGTPVAFGFNSVSGVHFRHAEVDAINKYLRIHGIKGWEKPKSCILHA